MYRFCNRLLPALVAAYVALALPASVTARTTVVFGGVTSTTINLAPLIVAQELGFFKDEGLEVEIVEFNGTGTLLPQLATKRVTVGYPQPDALIVARQPGKDHLPLKFFYNTVRVNPWEFIVLEGSPIKELTDLRGKTIGVGALSFGNIPITKAMFKELGLQVGRDVDLAPVGIGSPAFLALKTGKVDALNLFDTQHATLEMSGTDIRRLAMPQKYIDLFSNAFMAHEDTIKNDPKTLIGFGRAYAKATIVCATNASYCVRTFWRRYPAQKPSEGDEAQKLQSGIQLMNLRLSKALSGGTIQELRFGAYSREPWNNFIQALYDGGQLITTEIDIDSLYTNALVDEMNRFDRNALINTARTLK